MIEDIQNNISLEQTLAKQVIGLAMKVHRTLGCGFLESVYSNALGIELEKNAIFYEREKTYPVFYEDREIGIFQSDFVVENRLIVEVKAVDILAIAHSIQLVNYLSASKVDVGLLVNFGARSLDFKTKTRIYAGQFEAINLQS